MKTTFYENGVPVLELDLNSVYTFQLETVWGGKEYQLNFNHPKDRDTRERDPKKISGAQLTAK